MNKMIPQSESCFIRSSREALMTAARGKSAFEWPILGFE
jgi:hypothetical protein